MPSSQSSKAWNMHVGVDCLAGSSVDAGVVQFGGCGLLSALSSINIVLDHKSSREDVVLVLGYRVSPGMWASTASLLP